MAADIRQFVKPRLWAGPFQIRLFGVGPGLCFVFGPGFCFVFGPGFCFVFGPGFCFALALNMWVPV